MKSNIAEIEERLGKATPGPWKWFADDESQLALVHGEFDNWILACTKCDSCQKTGNRCRWPEIADADFIAHAPDDTRSLLADVEKAKDLIQQLLKGGVDEELQNRIQQFLSEPEGK